MITLDFETRSEANIWNTGAWGYAEHPSTEILCMAYAIDDGPVKIWKWGDFLHYQNFGCPDFDLMERVYAGELLCAHNALFEQAIWDSIMVKQFGAPRVPIKQWRCTAAKAAARSLPRSLKDCGAALGLTAQKDTHGQRVMLKLCKPRPDGSWYESELDMEILYDYCKQDVAVEREVDRMLPDLIPSEQNIWFLDQLINRRGVYVDIQAVKRSLEFIEGYSSSRKNFVSEVSEGQLDGVSRRMAVLEWCRSQGVDINGYTRMDVEQVLRRTNIPDNVRAVLETKLSLGRTSTAKYQAMHEAVCADGRIKDLLVYHGASTGRWAGKLIQLQNLPKGNVRDTDTAIEILKSSTLEEFEIFYPDVMGTLSSCIRGMIIAAPGNKLLVADYAAIEARVVMWLAGEEYGLKQFRDGTDIYIEMAKTIFSQPDSISKAQRQLGKAAVLGCSYGMGFTKFAATCATWGIPITKKLAQKAVSTYRSVYSCVCSSWFEQEAAAIRTVKTREDTNCGLVRWQLLDNVLLCKLPSGRSITYNAPVIKWVKPKYPKTDEDGEPVLDPLSGEAVYVYGAPKEALSYMGVDPVTNQWIRKDTYGGRIVENITQAVARDILAEAMFRCEKRGYSVAFSVHDEIVSEVPEGFGSLEDFENLLTTIPMWASGCPITATGFETCRYRKD